MSSEQITRAAAADQPALHRLWEAVFHDSPELIQAFFDHFPPELSGWVVRRGNDICSAAYLIPGNWFLNGSEQMPAAYLYAVATEPAERGKGYAGALSSMLAEFAEERGLLLYTRPAEQSLFPWYVSKLNTNRIGYQKSVLYSACSAYTKLRCQRISPETYRIKREAILQDAPHIVMSDPFLQLQEIYSEGYYEIGSGICNVIKNDGSILIPELLISEEQTGDAVSTLMDLFSASSAEVRFPKTEAADAAVVYTGNEAPTGTGWGFYLE